MPTTRKSTTTQEVTISFELDDYSVKVQKAAYYFLRDKIAYQIKLKLGEKFNWDDYLAEFENNFGTPSEYKLSLKQMLDFTERKFGANPDKIMQFNRESYQRRQARKAAEVN